MHASEKPAVLKVDALAKSFDGHTVFKDVSFEVAAGEALAVIGASGAGKTTLLRCINLLERIDAGAMSLNGKRFVAVDGRTGGVELPDDLSEVRRQIGMVFQEWNLWPNKTVRQNVAEGPLIVLRKSRRAAAEIAARLLDEVGLSEKLDAYPNELSGGQKQRVAIARALAVEPEVLMLDEITSALDPSRVAEILELVKSLKRKGRTLVVVTHHMAFARELSDKVIFLADGTITESGPPEKLFDSPRTPQLAEFLRTIAMSK